MNEKSQRRTVSRLRQEQVNELPRRIAIGKPELGAAALERVGAIKLRVARPARKNLDMFRHAGAVVVLGLIVDGGHRRLPRTLLTSLAHELAARESFGQAAAP
jgi:hypothetical protein